MTSRMLFTPALYRLLIEEGYSYIFYQGMEIKLLKDDTKEQDEYILVPYKHDFSINFEEANSRVENIHSMDVMEMLEYTLGIDFWIEAAESLIAGWRKQLNE